MSDTNAPLFITTLQIAWPPIGLYDTPDISPFNPIAPKPKHCFFSHYENWMRGEYTHLTRTHFSCPGCGHWLLDASTRSQVELIDFLVRGEGLKVSYDLMGQWINHQQGYVPQYENLVVGPLVEGQEEYLKTVTLFITPDQLSALMIGTQYFAKPSDPDPVICRFGSGCSQLVALFDDLTVPQSLISMTDTAMRQHLPANTLGLTMTLPMYEQLCRLDEESFLSKPFWRQLCKAREDF
jgi:hypothetical protein